MNKQLQKNFNKISVSYTKKTKFLISQSKFDQYQQINIILRPLASNLQKQYIFNLNLQQLEVFRLYMRKRSGAMHCDTQTEYIELASSHNTSSGLFYNEIPVNSKVRKRKYAISLDEKTYQSQNLQSDKQQLNTSKNLFNGFDFDHQSYAFSKDKQELQVLQQYLSTKVQKNNFLIITKSNPNQVFISLSRLKNIHIQPSIQQYMRQSYPPLQLLIDKKVIQSSQLSIINTFWIANIAQMQKYNYLLDVYISTSSKILLLCDDEFAYGYKSNIARKIKKSRLEDFIEIIQTQQREH